MNTDTSPFTLLRSAVADHPYIVPWPTEKRWLDKALLVTLGAAVVSSLIVILRDGDITMTLGLYSLILTVILTLYRTEWGFYLFIASVLIFDQYTIPEFDPVTYKFSYFLNLNQSYLLNVPLAVANPLELHLLLIVAAWIAKIALKKELKLQRVPVWPAALIFFVALTLSIVSGLAKGGQFLAALWEVRAMYYLGFLYIFVPQIIQTREQVTNVLWICIITISVKGLQGVIRFVQLGFSFGSAGALTGHEDAAFIVTMFVLFLSLVFFGVHSRQRRALAWLMPVLVGGFIAGQRRAAFGSFAATIIVLLMLSEKRYRVAFLKVLIPAVFIFAVYLVLFWNSGSQLGVPAQLVKTSFTNDRETAGERYYSNLYRVNERYNLAMTIRRAPLFGIGFGNKYDMPIHLPGDDFSMRVYIAHCEILWLFANMGVVGFFTFWLFINSFLAEGASTFSRLKDPFLKAVCAVIIAAVINQVFVSYFDLQLTFYRNMAYLGVLMGMLPTLAHIQSTDPAVVVS